VQTKNQVAGVTKSVFHKLISVETNLSDCPSRLQLLYPLKFAMATWLSNSWYGFSTYSDASFQKWNRYVRGT